MLTADSCRRALPALVLTAATACSYDLNERATATAADAPAAPALRGVRWELRELGGQAAPATTPRPTLVLHTGDRLRVEGEAPCNRFNGPFRVAGGGALRLGPLLSTRRACPDLALEGTYLQALNQTRHYRLRGSSLLLYAADTLGTPLARLEAVGGE